MGLTVKTATAGGIENWLARLKSSGNRGVRVGVLEGATNTRKNDNGTSVSVATYAFWNEYGTERIPSRPFLRSTIAEKKSDWSRVLADALSAAGTDTDRERAWRTLGRAAQSDVQETILSSVPPPNAPSTVRRKTKKIVGGEGGTYAPGTLVDTGTLLNAIDFEVTELERD